MQEIARQAEEAWPEEACGLLIGYSGGSGDVVTRAEPCRNVHPGDRRRRFQIDPEQQLAVQRESRGQGLEILGFYHSHPEGRARPSEEDARMAHPGQLMLIVALRGGRVAEARAWRFDGSSYAEVPLQAAD